MKGVVFKELISMAESVSGDKVVDEVLRNIDLDSEGAYTSVGTYSHEEVLKIVTALSSHTGVEGRDLVKSFGKHLLTVFHRVHPEYFDKDNADDFLSSVDSYIHKEVRKLYPDATLPVIEFNKLDDGNVVVKYTSERPFADLAEGLIEQTYNYFNESVEISTTDTEIKNKRTFHITRVT